MSDFLPKEKDDRRQYEADARSAGVEPIDTRDQAREFLDRTVGESNVLEDSVKAWDAYAAAANSPLTDTPGKRVGINPNVFNQIDAGVKAARAVSDPHRANREGVRIGVGLTNRQLDERAKTMSDAELRARLRRIAK